MNFIQIKFKIYQFVKTKIHYIVISPEFALPHEGFDRGCNEVGMNLIRLKEPVMIEDITFLWHLEQSVGCICIQLLWRGE